MRYCGIYAAAALLSPVAADVHKLKLKKYPLAEQLVSLPNSCTTLLPVRKRNQDSGLGRSLKLRLWC